MLLQYSQPCAVAGGFLTQALAPADINAAAQVHHRAWQATYQNILPPDFLDATPLTYFQDMWSQHFSSQPRHGYAVGLRNQQNELVGIMRCGASVGVASATNLGELYQLYLLPEAQGQGQGQKLFRMACFHLHQHGYPAMKIEVDAGNQNARVFYEGLGATLLQQYTAADQRGALVFDNPVVVLRACTLQSLSCR